jgi:hypothetical protein
MADAAVSMDTSGSSPQPAAAPQVAPAPSAKVTSQETPESLAAMKKQASLKFEEAAKVRKEAEAMKAEALKSKAQIEEFIKLSQTNPRALEKIYGRDVAKKIAEDLLYGLYEEEKLSPEQRAAKEKKAADEAELEEYRADKKKRDEEGAKTEREKLISEQATEIDTMIVNAIKEYDLKPTPKVIKRIAEYLDAQLDAGQELNAGATVPKVHEELHYDVVGYIKDMPIEQLVEEFPTLIKRVREFDMKQNEAVPNFKSGFTKPETEKVKKPQTEKKLTIDDYFKGIG